MKLNELSPSKGSRKPKKRLGRGVASGHGKTAGRGTKGQNSRSGGGVRPGFEGGQMPIQRRLPKLGFRNIFSKNYEIINIRDLSKFESGKMVDKAALINAGLIKGNKDGIKLLGNGEIKYPLSIKVDKISSGALEKIKTAGCSIEVS